MAVEIGQVAPDFSLVNQFGQNVTLSGLRGARNVVLMFFPFAFSRDCTGELRDVRDHYPDLVGDHSEFLSVSCDSSFTLKAFAQQESLSHSLLSDFWPHGAVTRAYGVFVESLGMPMRATFVIDKQGIVRWSVVHPRGELRDVGEYVRALTALS